MHGVTIKIKKNKNTFKSKNTAAFEPPVRTIKRDGKNYWYFLSAVVHLKAWYLPDPHSVCSV